MKGLTSIAMISGVLDDVITGKSRFDGYNQAIQNHSINLDSGLEEYGDFSYSSGIVCTKRLLVKFRPKN